jgi:tetratricopeptide (TPR) repeat protein
VFRVTRKRAGLAKDLRTRAGFRGLARIVAGLLFTAGCGLFAANGHARNQPLAEQGDAALLQAAGAAMSKDDLETAAQALAVVAARKPRDASVQTLLALTYHRAADRNAGNLDLAMAGYDIALNVQPGNFWAAAFAGRIAYDRGDYELALSRFAQAVLARPQDHRALVALAASAYMAGDADLASLAADRAAEASRDTPEAAMALRLAALSSAAAARNDAAARHLEELRGVSAELAADTGFRLEHLRQTSAVDAASDPTVQEPAGGQAPVASDQIMVDVAIVLSQRLRRERVGLNLLDGLNLNYGYGRSYVNTRDKLQGVDPVTTAHGSSPGRSRFPS